jgi:type VI secretion system Hcp family effector
MVFTDDATGSPQRVPLTGSGIASPPPPECSATGSRDGALKLFLKLTGIPGDSTDAAHPGEIELASYSQEVSNDPLVSAKAQFPLIRLRKAVDSASVKFMLASEQGTHLSSATLGFRQGQAEFYQVKLSDVQIILVNPVSASAARGPLSFDQLEASDVVMGDLEEVTLSFTKIEWSYTTPHCTKIRGGWDTATNQSL